MSPWNPAVWLSQNWLYILAWAGVLVFLNRLYSIVRRFEKYGEGIAAAKEDLAVIKTNHLAHIQGEQEKTNDKLDKTNDALHGLREDMRSGLSGLRDDIRAVLTRMA